MSNLKIIIEGEANTGKTTVAEEVRRALVFAGFKVGSVKEPVEEHLPDYFDTEKQTARVGALSKRGITIDIEVKQTARNSFRDQSQ